MRQLLIVKTGTTWANLRRQRGDFEDWILSGLGVSRRQVLVADVTRGAPLPKPAAIAGAVITGSHDRVTDRLAWSERTAGWLRGAVTADLPILGICYGHQLLAYALGGEVENSPQGLHLGTVTVRLQESAAGDRLLRGLPPTIDVQVAHAQSVRRLPRGACLLAASNGAPQAAFRAGDNAWGLQFHPEFDVAVVQAYIHRFQEELARGGQNPAALVAACRETPSSAEILRRFAGIALARRRG